MAQLKVKQISDFVTAVGTIHNGTVGTAAGSAIAGVQADVDVNTSAIALNTAKVGITTDQSSAIVANSAKVGITTTQSSAIVANSAKVGITTTQSSAIVANTAKVGITTDQSSAIVANSAKVGITTTQSSAIVANSAKVGITTAQSSAIAANTSGVATEKARIDALLLDSTDALDTFAEISNFIGSLDTGDVAGLSAALSTAVSNDAVHAAGISTNSQAIANLDLDFSGDFDSLGSADAAYDAAVLESTRLGNLAYDRLGDAGAAETAAKSYADGLAVNYDAAGDADAAETAAKSYADGLAVNYDAAGDADAAEAAAIAAANSYTNGRETIIKAYADTAEADAVASANSYTNTSITALDADLQGQIDNLAGVNSVEVIAVFDSATEFSTATQFALNSHVVVFVNGLQIHEAGEGIDGWRSLDGRNFTVEGLGYDLEGDDHIVVSGTVA